MKHLSTMNKTMLYILIVTGIIFISIGSFFMYLKHTYFKLGTESLKKANFVGGATQNRKDIPYNIQRTAKDEVTNKYKANDPQIMDEPAPILKNGIWVFTITDISAQLPPSGFSIFVISANATTGEILTIVPGN